MLNQKPAVVADGKDRVLYHGGEVIGMGRLQDCMKRRDEPEVRARAALAASD